jgi:hypothetical protein
MINCPSCNDTTVVSDDNEVGSWNCPACSQGTKYQCDTCLDTGWVVGGNMLKCLCRGKNSKLPRDIR